VRPMVVAATAIVNVSKNFMIESVVTLMEH